MRDCQTDSWGDVLISPGPGAPAEQLGVYLHRNFVFTGLAAIGMKFYLCSKVTGQCNRNLKYEILLPPPPPVNSNSYRVGSVLCFEVERKDEKGKNPTPSLFVFLKIKLICTRTQIITKKAQG